MEIQVEQDMAESILALLGEMVVMLDAIQLGPTPDDVATAPLLQNWRPLIDRRRVPLLWGDLGADGETDEGPIITSRLLGMDPDRKWARTEETWYRLGEPSDATWSEPEIRGADDGDPAAPTIHLSDYTQISRGPFLDRLLLDSDLRIRRLRDGLARAIDEARAKDGPGDGEED